MPPFADAMGFVNSDQTDLGLLQELLKPGHNQAFRGRIEDFYLTLARLRLNSINFSRS
jgi:hypothetical protein